MTRKLASHIGHPLPLIDEHDFERVLKELGFNLAKSEIRGVEFSGQENEGVPGVVLVAAVRD